MKVRPLKFSKMVLALAGLSIFPLTSQASLVIKLDDGTNPPIVISDNAIGDTTALAGVNTINKSLGNWLVNVVSSANIGSTLTSPLLSLTSFNVSFTGATAPTSPLKIFLTDTGYGPTPGLFNLHVGGTQSGGASVTAKYFYDTGNNPFALSNQLGTTQTFTTGAYSNQQTAGPGGIIPNFYSLTLEADITNVPGGFFNSQFTSTLSAAPVPLPAAAWLFGSAVMGLLGMRKRKKAI
ncbi:hypothetical protein MGMO_4c00220 [Methyloglobulus morosus KoM1]|uniref:Uncharacterized protein n=1 Tax=Methyloglobulus morosus KoM1 TaxID=1116472 RepID=V5BLD0_9GAMM|nr:hypothetical protein [Methyloglobulus morosus]ESS74110.1 hypothetical protein MGMO_4c00220 [Methyloglobulus morosus KoM1]